MMKSLVVPYLEAKESVWAPSTWKSEKSRLTALGDSIDLEPKALHKKLQEQGMKPYSMKTLFIRLSDLQRWAKVPSTFGDYLEAHKNRFKHVYHKEEIVVTFDEARERIEKLSEPVRTMAIGLLTTGLRISEAYSVKEGRVVGKGGKHRKVYGEIRATVAQGKLRRELKAIGLKPHTLRKLCATRLAEKGASAADLCKIFGWSDISTSYQYLQARDDERMKKLFED